MISIKQYKEKLFTALYTLYQNHQFCDLTIKLKDGEVKVHRLILCASSDFFQTLLSTKVETGMMCLSDITLKEMEAVLRFVYTGEINPDKIYLKSDLLKKFGLIDKEFSPEEELANVTMTSVSSLKSQIPTEKSEKVELLKSNSQSVPASVDESQILSSASADKVFTEENCSQNHDVGERDRVSSLQDHFVSYSRSLSEEQKSDPSVDKNIPVSKSCHTNCSNKTEKQRGSYGSSDIDDEQASCSGGGIVNKCTNSCLISKNKGRININERSKSRDIVQEAYMTAMDMDLTDTDGGISADNCDQNNGDCDREVKPAGYNTSDITVKSTCKFDTFDRRKETDLSNGVAITDDVTVNLAKSSDNLLRTAGELSGALLTSGTVEKKMVTDDTEDVCKLNLAERKSADIVTGNDVKDNSSQIGVVSGLRSRNGKRPRKVYTDNVSEEVLNPQLGTNRVKCSKYKKMNCLDNINDIENDTEKVANINTLSEAINENGHRRVDDKDHTNLVNVIKTVKKGQNMWYCCPECDRTFKSLKLVAGHRHSKHNVAFDPSEFEVHKCKDCAYETLEVHRLACHQVTSHSAIRPYVCEWCGKDFKLLGALTLHTNTHTKARKFECPHCNKVFTQHGARKRHIEEKHEKSSRHLCDVCPYSALDRVKLVQHKYINHSAPLPPGYTIYRCTEAGCKFETFRKQLFTGHINTHNGVQEYVCDVCQKKFSSAGNMRSHRTVHKDKSLSCSYAGCDFTTRVNNRLAQHVRLMHTHRDMKPHVCPHCPYKTAIKGNLHKHQRNIHRATQNISTNVENSGHKGDNTILETIQGDNSSMESSTRLLKSLLYSSGTVQFVDVTKQHLSDTQEIIVNGIAPEVILGGVTQMVLGIEQS